MNRPDQLEIHIAHACNYTCESCSHFSQFHMPGILSLETAETWYQAWSPRLNPRRFTLLGGEPTINPKLVEHVELAAKYWPCSQIRVTTNGSLLYRHARLPEAMAKIPNHLLQLSKHYDEIEFNAQFGIVVALCEQWKRKYGINYVISDSFEKWTRRYVEGGSTIHPFTDNNPRQSWKNCHCRKCVELHEGKLWKCPTMAYLPQVKKRLSLGEEWRPYLAYEPLKQDCTNAELDAFFAKKAEPVCGMCPAFARPFTKSNPKQLYYDSLKQKY